MDEKREGWLEYEIEQLKEEIERKDRIIAERERVCKVMFNRCYATCMGTLCRRCLHREMCERERSMGGGKRA